MALDLNAVSLTPLTTEHFRALESLTSGWRRPPGSGGVTASTMGPEAYRRRRRRFSLIVACALAGMVILGPIIVVMIALWNGDQSALKNKGMGLLLFVIGAVALGGIGAVISWFQTGEKHRTNAGAEPATQFTFVATTSGLRVGDATGRSFEAPWARWRIANVRSDAAQLRSGVFHVLETLDLVMLAEDGTRAGSVTLDPPTLTGGRDFAATVVGMIASRGAT